MQRDGRSEETWNQMELELPCEVEAEIQVLGGILLYNDLLPQTALSLRPADFFIRGHQFIFEAMLKMFKEERPMDAVTVGAELHKIGRLDEIGGLAYLAELMSGLFRTVSYPEYIRLVREASSRRQLITGANALLYSASDPEESLADILSKAQTSISNIAEQNDQRKSKSILDIARKEIEYLESMDTRSEGITGLPSGLNDLDILTSGFQPTDLIIIAARPSNGKTSLALCIAENVSGLSKSVVFFSAEMSEAQIGRRMLCSKAHVDQHKFRSRFLNKEESSRIALSLQSISDHNRKLVIDDRPNPTVLQIRSQCLNVRAEQGIDLVIVDYLQLVKAQGKFESREKEVSQVSADLKALAKDLNVPVIALSQLNRAIEHRTAKRPMMSDLRESGSIENDADLIIFIHREEYYDPVEENAGIAELIIGKQRNGPTESVRVAFIKQFTRFENLWKE